MEEWKEYSKGVYVSNCGRVVRDNGHSGSFNPHVVNGSNHNKGYLQIKINKKMLLIHRLVGELFIPNPDNKPTIDHINRIRDFNIVSNLRWADMEEQNNNQGEHTNNKLGEKNISITYMNNGKYKYYRFSKKGYQVKLFKKLEDAIIYRNLI